MAKSIRISCMFPLRWNLNHDVCAKFVFSFFSCEMCMVVARLQHIKKIAVFKKFLSKTYFTIILFLDKFVSTHKFMEVEEKCFLKKSFTKRFFPRKNFVTIFVFVTTPNSASEEFPITRAPLGACNTLSNSPGFLAKCYSKPKCRLNKLWLTYCKPKLSSHGKWPAILVLMSEVFSVTTDTFIAY